MLYFIFVLCILYASLIARNYMKPKYLNDTVIVLKMTQLENDHRPLQLKIINIIHLKIIQIMTS